MGRYVGKFEEVEERPRFSLISWALILIAVSSLAIGGVVAYLSTYTTPAKNTFVKDESVNPSVVETFENNIKTNVKIDVGEPGYAVYVRAAVVVTWKDGAGNVLGRKPIAGTDYAIEYNSDDWHFRDSDSLFYYKAPVFYDGNKEDSKLTSSLIVSCEPIEGKTPTGYGLNVEIIAQTIQAVGTTDGNTPVDAVEAAWGIPASEFITQNP